MLSHPKLLFLTRFYLSICIVCIHDVQEHRLKHTSQPANHSSSQLSMVVLTSTTVPVNLPCLYKRPDWFGCEKQIFEDPISSSPSPHSISIGDWANYCTHPSIKLSEVWSLNAAVTIQLLLVHTLCKHGEVGIWVTFSLSSFPLIGWLKFQGMLSSALYSHCTCLNFATSDMQYQTKQCGRIRNII